MKKSRLKTASKALATVLATMMIGTASAGTWYQVNVVQVVPRMDTGDVIVQFRSTGTAFEGIARGMLIGTEPGTNRMLAVMLSAIALNTPITVELNNAPAPWPAQPILGTGLVAPTN